MSKTKFPGQVSLGIVGSRRRNTSDDEAVVFMLVEALFERFGDKLVVISGGAVGPDSFGEKAARIFGVEFIAFDIAKLPEMKNKYDFVKRAFGRNEKIAKHSDVILALVADDRKGGTENTIEHANKLGVQVFLLKSDELADERRLEEILEKMIGHFQSLLD